MGTLGASRFATLQASTTDLKLVVNRWAVFPLVAESSFDARIRFFRFDRGGHWIDPKAVATAALSR